MSLYFEYVPEKWSESAQAAEDESQSTSQTEQRRQADGAENDAEEEEDNDDEEEEEEDGTDILGGRNEEDDEEEEEEEENEEEEEDSQSGSALMELRRQAMIESLIAMGFPVDWALRASEHCDVSSSESAAISWIIERMELEQSKINDVEGDSR